MDSSLIVDLKYGTIICIVRSQLLRVSEMCVIDVR